MEFEDLVWLFNCGKESRGIVRLNLDEGAYLYKIAKSLKNAKILEIGRFEGGSTILLASTGNELDSIDIAPKNDTFIEVMLRQLVINNQVNLIINDTKNMNFPENKYDLIFIDGGHSYEQVKNDFLKVKKAVKIGGHLLFHDYSPTQPEVVKFIDELKGNKKREFQVIKQVNSLIHFIRVK